MIHSNVVLAGSGLLLAVTTACPLSFAETTLAPRPVTEGESILLDPSHPQYGSFFAAVRRKITNGWRYPCVKAVPTGECEYRSARVIVEFGIFSDGELAFVVIRQSSGIAIYDDYVLDAIRDASPFTPPPPALATMRSPDGRARILAEFRYHDGLPESGIIR